MAKNRSGELASALEACSRMAQEDVRELLGKLDLDKPVECKQVLLVAYPAIIAKYGNMAAAAAAEFYAAERADVLGGDYEPVLAEPVNEEAIKAKIRYTLRYLFEEAGDGEPGE